jgi:hypothetical protein
LTPTFENVYADETKQKGGRAIVVYSWFLDSQAREQFLEIRHPLEVIGFWLSFAIDDLCFLIKFFFEISC